MALEARGVAPSLFFFFDVLSFGLISPPSPHLSPPQGMESPPLTEYKAERGLQEVLCKIGGTYRSLDDMATRLHRALTMVTSIHYFFTYSVHPSLSFLLSHPPPPSSHPLPSSPSSSPSLSPELHLLGGD